MTYFRMGNPYYHRRDAVSRPCSGWEGVGPVRYARQEFFWFRRGLWPVAVGPRLTHSGEVKLGKCLYLGRDALFPARLLSQPLKVIGSSRTVN